MDEKAVSLIKTTARASLKIARGSTKDGRKPNAKSRAGLMIRLGAIVQVKLNGFKHCDLNDPHLSNVFEGKSKDENFWATLQEQSKMICEGLS